MMAHEYLDLVAGPPTLDRMHGPILASRLRRGAVAHGALVGPTVASWHRPPARPCSQDAARDTEFFRVNALLLRNTSVVNMLDGCALSLPCHTPDELPVGLMVWHGAGRDDTVLNLGLRIEEILQIQ
jgi:aspartyl-tRNA(Asn)/glutamyl-tRNA(Gln) amidotransferase subunit A